MKIFNRGTVDQKVAIALAKKFSIRGYMWEADEQIGKIAVTVCNATAKGVLTYYSNCFLTHT